jgi:hypothetical protein
MPDCSDCTSTGRLVDRRLKIVHVGNTAGVASTLAKSEVEKGKEMRKGV